MKKLKMSIKFKIKDFVYFFVNLVTVFRPNRAIVLMYHSVGKNKEFFTVQPADFEKQLAFLKQKDFKVISLAELYRQLTTGENITPKTVVLTFDDGYEDNFIFAFPLLKKYNFFATIFINTDSIGKTRQARFGTVLPVLPLAAIKEMSESGLVEFGSHAHSHIKLTKMEAGEIETSLIMSKNILTDLLKREINFFAYPTGKFNDLAKQLAAKFFKLAVTVKAGFVNQATNLYLLNRNAVDSKTSFLQFKGILKFGKL